MSFLVELILLLLPLLALLRLSIWLALSTIELFVGHKVVSVATDTLIRDAVRYSTRQAKRTLKAIVQSFRAVIMPCNRSRRRRRRSSRRH